MGAALAVRGVEVDGGGGDGAGDVVVEVVVGMEDVDGYWRRAVEAAVRATLEDEEPMLGWVCWVWLSVIGQARQIDMMGTTRVGDFISFN